MIRKPTILSAMAVAMAITAVTPAMAQDQMKKMSKADTAMMTRCQALGHDAMAKDRKCVAFMKAHPDAMEGDAMMAHDDQMKKKQ